MAVLVTSIAVTVSLALSWFLQILGSLTGTCTQGDNGPAVNGAVFSAAPLAVAVAGSAIFFRTAKRSETEQPVFLGLLPLALVAAMLITTRETWLNVIRYGTPCGADYQSYGTSLVAQENALILISYFLVPALICSLLLAALAISKLDHASNRKPSS
ncbi:hypothetical protein [Roseibium sp.]|uniref:hypothetical protein n=1 Tax=Roseibium sp. TaxID=1936156 RepID=UPI003A9707D7